MRVIAGSARGIKLSAPRDRGIRPITDRVKETLFGILGERVIDARVLDLYAGSGAVGIEALSRGAAQATFVDKARAALTTITENLRRSGLAETAEVRGEDVSRYLASAAARDERFDLVVLDPPYEARAILPPLEGVVALLAPSAMVVVKHFWRTSVPVPDGLRMWRDRRFGETTLTFLEAQ
ncbi:MAG TPA: 16S rRNA (guanine(966)-N(2))-methyltransferase RsmD [Candidatus Limnocylindria bacterium]|jgi:16S rRNA (guanine966-N2)-methyltransferase